MAEHFVANLADASSLSIAKGDYISIGGLGTRYQAYDKLSAITSGLGAIKKTGSFYLVPIDKTLQKSTTKIYNTSSSSFSLFDPTLIGTFSEVRNIAGSGSKPVSQSFIQSIYDINKPAVVSCPVSTSPVNFRQLYGELQSVSFTGYGLLLFNDKWFYSNDKYATCSLFPGSGKGSFGENIVWVAIPNR